MTTFRNICHGEKYTSQGEERMKWTQVGTLIEKDGKFYVKMKYIPLAMDPDYDGYFFMCFDQDHNRKKPSDPTPADFDESEDIPF